MTSDTSNSDAPPFAKAIAAAVEALETPLPGMSKAERDKVHTKNLRSIAFHDGFNGVTKYKDKHPEANHIRVNINTLAHAPKPSGYADYLAQLVERWLTDEAALNSTNVADVDGLNLRFGTIFPRSKHFSEPLSEGRLNKIKSVFARHHLPLDIAMANTMSKVREAAKAGKARVNGDKPFGNVGTISDNTLIIRQQSFAIELNGKRECIRVLIDNKRCRFYLNELEWLAHLMVSPGDALSNTTLRSMGELAYSAETAENGQDEAGGNSGLAYGRGPLGDRLAALNSRGATTTEEWPDGVDPLTL